MEPPVRRTPLSAWHQSYGAHPVNFEGWEMPLNYKTGIVGEHLATRKFAGLFDISHMGRFIIRGAGSLPFLQYLLTNNAAVLRPGQAQYTTIAGENGGAVDDAYLYRLGEEKFLLVVNASNTAKDWAWLEEHRRRFPATSLEDYTERMAMASFQGPRSKAILEKITAGGLLRLPEPGRNNLRKIEIEGAAVITARTGYTGDPIGFELFFPADRAVKVWEKILEAGREEGAVPAGLGARDTLRLEAGLPLYGHEYGLDEEGQEIPILAVCPARVAVSFAAAKGNYIGREALLRQWQALKALEGEAPPPQGNPLPRQVFWLAILSEGVARQHFPVYIGDRRVGSITSGTMVPYWKTSGQGISAHLGDEYGRRAIALAYLDAGLKECQRVRVLSRGKYLEGMIVRRHLSSEAPPYAWPVFAEERQPVTFRRPAEALDSLASALVRKAAANTAWRQKQTVNLIPSEQTPSPLVKLLSIADPSGRYAEHRHFSYLGDAHVYYYQGTNFIEQVETRLREEMAAYLGCAYVETRVISGQMANAAVFSSLVDYINRADRKSEPRRLRRVLNHHIGRGGHLSSQPMGALRDFIAVDPLAERPAAVSFPVLEENPYQIDLARTEEVLQAYKPELIILGKSMMLHREPLPELRRMAEGLRPKPWILYDMAHVLGLIGPHFQQPFAEGADIVTGSTHKTFFGTQRGVIGANFENISATHPFWVAISRRTFPGSVSNHHLGTLLGLLLAAWEMNTFRDEYQKQITCNARAFARALKSAGLQVEGDPAIGYTETHQVILRVGYARGPEMAQALEKSHIIANYQALPDDEGFSASSGLRLGVQEMTRFGMKEEDFAEFAAVMAEVIRNGRDVGEEVSRFRSRFTKMEYCLPEEKARPLVRELLDAIF